MRQRIVKIDSDGMPRHTVISTDDGKELDDVISARWSLDVHDGIAMIELEIRGTAIHAEGHLRHVTFICPVCGNSEGHECDTGTSLSE